jgi:hypothetical protein
MKQEINSQFIPHLRRIEIYILLSLVIIAIQLMRCGLIPGLYCHKFVRWCTKRTILEMDKLPSGFIPDIEDYRRELKSTLSMTEATIYWVKRK